MRQKLDKLMNGLTSGLALIGAIGIIAMLIHVTAYVILRHVVSMPVPATVEIVSRYYMVLVAFLPLAWADRRGEMITVEIFDRFFTGPFERINIALVSLITCGAYIALTYTTWQIAMREFAAQSFVISLSVAIPTWPSYFILPIGFGLAAIVSLYRAVMPPEQGSAQ